MIIAVTGHQHIPASIRHEVESGVRSLLHRVHEESLPGDAITVLSCLAVGADQMVARMAVDEGLRFEAVIPSEGYESTFDADGLAEYQRLMRQSAARTVLPYNHPCGTAYMAAGRYMVDRCDWLLAIWDGLPSAALGGTGDVVAYARERQVPVHVVWKAGVVH